MTLDAMTETSPAVEARANRALGSVTREFLHEQVDALEPFGFLALASPASPFEPMEIARTEDGHLEVRVPPRLSGEAVPVPGRTKLVEAGFSSNDPARATEPWTKPVDSAEEGIDLALQTLLDVFAVDVGDSLDVAHGSHEGEVDLERRMESVRQQLEPVLADVLGRAPERDDDEDYVCVIDGVKVFVTLRAGPGIPIVIRMFAITNGGVAINPELGLFLARLNYMQTFGRFVLDLEHQTIWIDDTLLGEHADEEEIRFTLEMVARTAKRWDENIKTMFGGVTQADIESHAHPTPTSKPGFGGYL